MRGYLETPLLLVDSERAIQKMEKWKRPPCDFQIQYHRKTKEWYCLFPYPLEEQQGSKEEEIKKHSVVALDPGARAFLTAYSPTAGCGKLMTGALDRPKQLAERIDQLNSTVAKLKQLKRRDRIEQGYGQNCIRNRTRKIHRLWKKIRDIRHHFHYSTIQFLVDNFENILLPNFQTQKMIQKETRNIGKRSAKELLSWGHYEFKTRLLSKTVGRGTRVYLVGEEYTTKSCGRCGLINDDIEGSETFWCDGCGLKGVDRDVHAARNILMKYLA